MGRFTHALGIVALAVLAPAALGQLVSHWRFEAVGSLIAVDETGSYPGTLMGQAQIVSGGIGGGCLQLLKATGDYVTMGTGFPGFYGADYTTVVWVKTTSSNDVFPIAKHWSGQSGGYFTLIGTSAGGQFGAPGKACSYNGGYGANSPVSVTTVNDDAWHQVVSSRGGSTAHVFVDGVHEDSRPAAMSNPNNAPLMLGSITYGGNPGPNYTGLMDEVQVYARALTSDEVGFLYANPGKSIKAAPPETVTVRLGRKVAGTVASFAAVDGDVFGVCKFIVPNQLVAPITVELTGRLTTQTPSFLRFVMYGRMTSGGQYEQILELYNFVQQGWDPVDTSVRTIGTAFMEQDVVGTGDLARYVDSTKTVWARYRVRQTGVAATNIWCCEHDLARWAFAE